jgi:hypothetical protein
MVEKELICEKIRKTACEMKELSKLFLKEK